MMASMRSSVWRWIGLGLLVVAALALVVIDLGQGGGRGARQPQGEVLATVGKREIGEAEFVRRLGRAAEQERQRTPELTQTDFIRRGGADLVFRQMVAGEALEQFGARHGVTVSERMIDGEIASIPAAQVNGRFDEATFRRLLEAQRVSEAEVRDGIRQDLMRRQLIAPVALGAHVPQGMAEAYAALLLEVREGEIAAIPFGAMPDPGQPSDAQLETFWKANRQMFTVPERRAFRFAMIEPDGLAEQVQVSPAEVEAYYKANLAEFGGEELREMNQVVLASLAEAQAFVREVRGGTPFATAAAARGFTPRDTALGLTSEAALADDTSAGVAAAAFRAAAGSITNPIEGPLGFHVVEVVSVRPAAPKPLRAVAAEIEKKLIDERVQARLAETINEAEDRIDAGEPFSAVAEALGLRVQTVEPVTADGLRLTEAYELERVMSPLVDRAFSIDPGDGPQVVQAGEGRFALIEIAEVKLGETIPVAPIRARVAAAWAQEQRQRAARALAEELAAKATAGETLAALVRGRNLPPAQSFAVRRLELTQAASQGDAIPPPILMLLNTPAGQARPLPVPQSAAAFVVRTVRVTPGDLAEAPELAGAVRQSLAREAALEMSEFYVRGIEREIGTVTRPQQLEAVKRRLVGAPAGE